MERPVWEGNISFGLLNIPVSLYSAERRGDLHFKLLDSRNKARIRYERINEETGEEVPWNKIVKAFEYNKGNYVVIEEKELKKIAPEHTHSIEIQDFVPSEDIDYIYFEKPYYLSSAKNAQKGYILLHNILKQTNKMAIVKVVIRTHQYLGALMPHHELLLLNLLRYQQEIKDRKDYIISEKEKNFKITKQEMKMAMNLVDSMSSKWDPNQYYDENRAILAEWIERKLKKKAPPRKKSEEKMSSNIIDFGELLKKSLKSKNPGKQGDKLHPERKTRKRSIKK